LCFLFVFLINWNSNLAYLDDGLDSSMSDNNFLLLRSQNKKNLKASTGSKVQVMSQPQTSSNNVACLMQPTSTTFAEVHFVVSCPETATIHIEYHTGKKGKEYHSPDFVVSPGEQKSIILSNLVPSSFYTCEVGTLAYRVGCDFSTAPLPMLGATAFSVAIPGLNNYDIFPSEYTCANPNAYSPPVIWANVPPGTQDLFLTFTEGDPFLGVRYLWAQYNINPAALSGLAARSTEGLSAYPFKAPCSAGNGWRPILVTLYALQYPLQQRTVSVPVSAEDLVKLIENKNLAIATATFRAMYCHNECW